MNNQIYGGPNNPGCAPCPPGMRRLVKCGPCYEHGTPGGGVERFTGPRSTFLPGNIMPSTMQPSLQDGFLDNVGNTLLTATLYGLAIYGAYKLIAD